MDPEAYCQKKALQSGSSFYYSFLFLPQIKRRAMIAIYAFCREMDDIVDNHQEAAIARIKLQWWRDELAKTYEGHPTHPISHALKIPIQHFEIRQKDLQDLITGMEMDLNHSGFANFEALNNYCYHAASTVGLLTAKVLGYQNPQTEKYATLMGSALQQINIIRDIGEDLRRGRCYLPLDECEHFQINLDEMAQYQSSPQLQKLLQFQANRARTTFHYALANLPGSDRPAQRVGIVMGKIYLKLLDIIEANQFDVLNQKIHLTPLQKLWTAYRVNRKEKKCSPQNSPPNLLLSL